MKHEQAGNSLFKCRAVGISGRRALAFFTLLFSLLLLSHSAEAKHKKRHDENEAASPTPIPFVVQPGQAASVNLGNFIHSYLDDILAPIGENKVMPRADLALMRAAFAGQYAQAQPSARLAFQYAVAGCDALGSAIDGREKAAASLQSGQASMVADIQDVRSSAPRRRHQSGAADRAEEKKDGMEQNSSNAQAADTGKFLDSGRIKAWDDLAAGYRTRIEGIYEQVLTAEAAGKSTPLPPAAASVPPR